jgi:hypothetical protein
MKKFMHLLIVLSLVVSAAVVAGTIDNISVDKIEIYTDKSKIPNLGQDGASIPAGVKVVVWRTNNQTYASWKFVAYGDSINETLSVILTAKAMEKNVSCVWEDRGNRYVQCIGVSF